MIDVKLDARSEREFAQAIKKLVLLSEEPVEEILRQQGRLFAVDAAKFTARYGDKAEAGRRHKEDVKRTIEFLYIKPLAMAKVISAKAGVKQGERFRNYIRRRNISAAQTMVDKFVGILDGYRIEVDNFDEGRIHKARITGKGQRKRMVCMNYREVDRYRRKAVANVGELKAGWAKAAEDLGGTRGIPAYAKKNHKTRGRGKVEGQKGRMSLTVANLSPYVLQNTDANKLFRMRVGKIKKLVERMIRSRGRKITRRV